MRRRVPACGPKVSQENMHPIMRQETDGPQMNRYSKMKTRAGG